MTRLQALLFNINSYHGKCIDGGYPSTANHNANHRLPLPRNCHGTLPHNGSLIAKRDTIYRNVANTSINIAYQMASKNQDESVDNVSWRLIGPTSELSKKLCRLMYSSLGTKSDVCLFYVNGEFYAMDARCAHSGGPLCDGDIEDANGVLQVFCPWHDYDFNLRTGKSNSGLQQQVYEVKEEDGSVYVKHASFLSLDPFPAQT